jgi:hypothetical protein
VITMSLVSVEKFKEQKGQQLYFLNTENCFIFASAEGEKMSTLELELPTRTLSSLRLQLSPTTPMRTFVNMQNRFGDFRINPQCLI